MPIIIAEPLILAESQTKQFKSICIRRNPQGLLSAELTFDILDGEGNWVKEDLRIFVGDEYNSFWAGFNNGKFLYEQIVDEVSDDIENEFVNE